ncbi:MAG TPA: hypothetical protein VGG32_07050 [Thermoplasmata archaeon]|jgi:hypothetical protein
MTRGERDERAFTHFLEDEIAGEIRRWAQRTFRGRFIVRLRGSPGDEFEDAVWRVTISDGAKRRFTYEWEANTKSWGNDALETTTVPEATLAEIIEEHGWTRKPSVRWRE